MEKESGENDACLDGVDNNKPKVAPRKSPLQPLLSRGFTRFTLAVVAVLLLLALVLFIAVVALAARPCGPVSDSDRPVCETPECHRTSALVAEQVNTSADPCSNFYQFACGGWLREHLPVPPSLGASSVLGEVQRDFLRQSRELVETLPFTPDFRSLPWKLKSFYYSCMDIDSIDSAGDSFLRRQIEVLKGWKPLGNFLSTNWDWNKVLRDLHVEYGVFPFFKVEVRPDVVNPIQNVIQILPSGLGLPHWSYYLRSPEDKVIKAYRKLMEDLANHLSATSQRAQALSDAAFHFEKRIAETILRHEEENDKENDKKKMTLNELMGVSKRIDWVGHLNAYLRNAYISENTPIHTPSKKYLIDLSTILSTTDSAALNSYLIWTFVFKYAPFLSQPYRKSFETYQQVYTGATEGQPRWEFCISTTKDLFNLALTSLYVEKNVPKDTFDEVKEIYQNMKNAFIDTLRNVDWMDSATRHVAIDKIRNIFPKVDRRDYVLDSATLNSYYDKLTVLKTDFVQSIQNWGIFKRSLLELAIQNTSKHALRDFGMVAESNSYNSDVNQIIIPAAFLEKPVFHSSYPKYLKYGTLGSHIGRGLIRGFEEAGKLFDRNGYTPIWWSNNTMVVFAEHKDCLSKHYYEYSTDGYHIDGNRSLSNNIADIGGLTQAYHAFTNWEYNEGLEPTLPGVPYTAEQLFFISYAQTLCSVERPEQLDNSLQLSDYPPGEIRVLGTLSQLPQFSAAFECVKGTTGNPGGRCSLW